MGLEKNYGEKNLFRRRSFATHIAFEHFSQDFGLRRGGRRANKKLKIKILDNQQLLINFIVIAIV